VCGGGIERVLWRDRECGGGIERGECGGGIKSVEAGWREC
jgi:hypothetical protein